MDDDLADLYYAALSCRESLGNRFHLSFNHHLTGETF